MLVAVNRPASLLVEVRDFDDLLATPSGSVTVSVQDASASVVATGTMSPLSTGLYSWALPTAITGTLGVYDATAAYVLSAASASTTVRVETVGDVLFGVSELRTEYPDLSSSSTYTAARIRSARDAATQRLERAGQVAFATRRVRRVLDGNGTSRLLLPDVMIQQVVACTIHDTTGTLVDTLDSTDLHAIDVDPDAGLLIWAAGWPSGSKTIRITYDHGYSTVPGPIRDAAMMLAFESLKPSLLPPRATSQATNLGDFRISVANPDAGRDTGIPEVDAAIKTWGRQRPRIGA